ncbi:MAG: isocitrate dehydrogenase kinase/phosphatase AceK regulatory subunit [Gemmatirosa sp.]
MSLRSATAAALAREVGVAYDAWSMDFRWATRRAAARFAARDWSGAQADSTRRLALWYHWIDHATATSGRLLGAARRDRELWRAVRDAYAATVAGRLDVEVAESFYNSLARRGLPTLGLDPDLHFVRGTVGGPSAAEVAAVAPPLPVVDGPEAVARAILARWTGPAPLTGPLAALGAERALGPGIPTPGPVGPRWADLEGDVRRLAAALESATRHVLGGWPDSGRMVDAPFLRGHGAYLVGSLARGSARCPLIVALRHPPGGVVADALVCTEDEASIVFGFAWSYFHVETDGPRALVAFLSSIMPRKRVDELYTAIGYHRHAKTELFRTLRAHLCRRRARFARAEGARGLVMEVFTLPSLDVVLKLIRDRFGAPKRTTRREVMERYHFVFVRDRVGRLADAQEFEGLVFRRRTFPEPLLAELAAAAPSVLRVEGDRVLLAHCYTQRRLIPLDVYVRTAAPDDAVAAVLDYGQAVRDLAVAGIFAGDLLLKNFGVSRHGRVIFYDYDELADLQDCRFLPLPDDDEWGGEPPTVGDHDVFPEEFVRFTLPGGRLREAFLARHGDLLDPAWWEATQARLRAGELVETLPYREERRLGGSERA